MKATLKETSTITLPEKRIWIIGYQNICFTCKSKKCAKQLKAVIDEVQPMITIKD